MRCGIFCTTPPTTRPKAARSCSPRPGKIDRIVLSVADSGPGIPEADLPRVFERFYRVDKARSRNTRDPGGTGLGLAIVKHLVGLHGGRVAVDNRPEGGAIFTMEMPGRLLIADC